MPEIVTKYPDIVLSILKEAKINCGGGAPQKILTSCPKENFCSLPTGELCVYNVQDIGQMTQINAYEACLLPQSTTFIAVIFAVVFLLGLFIGYKLK